MRRVPSLEARREKLEKLRSLAVRHLTEMRRMLAKPENVHEARAVPAERVGTFTLSPVSDSGDWSYSAKGSVDLFGQSSLRVDGAGGPDRTVRATEFSLPLAA